MFDLDSHKKKVNLAHNHIFQVIPREQKCTCKKKELLQKPSTLTTFEKSVDQQHFSPGATRSVEKYNYHIVFMFQPDNEDERVKDCQGEKVK